MEHFEMKVSVIVSDVNEQGMLLPCIHVLCTQDFNPKEYEIILPDYGCFSKENNTILRHFESQYRHLKILRSDIKNRCALINEAVRRAKGELLLFLESHCVADREWVSRYVDVFKKKNIQIARGSVQTIPTRSYLGRAEEYMRIRIVKNFVSRGTDKTYFDFHNSAMRKSCFIKAGGLSERIPLLAEFELGARIHQAGNDICIVPENIVWHANSTDFKTYAQVIGGQGRDKMLILIMRDKKFVQKYFPTRRSLQLLPFLKMFRWPLLAFMKSMICACMLGCRLGKLFNDQGVVNFYFYIFAKGCFWHGILIGLKEYELR